MQSLIDRREACTDQAFSALRDRLMGHARLQAKGRKALDAVRMKLDRDKEDLRPFVNALEPSLADRVASLAEAGKKSGLTYEALSVGADRILLEGTAERWDGCDELMKSLRAFGFSPKLQRKEALPDGRIPFIIKSGGDGGP